MRSRKNIGWALLVSFFVVAVFGFVAMGDGHGHTHGGCIAATASGVRNCQDSGDSTASLLFHIKTFKSFSQALTVGILVFVFAVFLFFALFSFAKLVEDVHSQQNSRFTVPRSSRAARLWQRTRQRIIYWLALHESRADGTLTGA